MIVITRHLVKDTINGLYYVGIHMEIYLSAMFLKISNNYRSENLIKSTKRLTFEVHLHETKKRYGYEII